MKHSFDDAFDGAFDGEAGGAGISKGGGGYTAELCTDEWKEEAPMACIINSRC